MKNSCDNNEFGIYWNNLMKFNSEKYISPGTWKYPEIIVENGTITINAVHMKQKDFSKFMEQYGELFKDIKR